MKHRRRQQMRQVTVIGDRVLSQAEATVVRLELSRSYRERQERSRLERRVARIEAAPERNSVNRAMLAVEERLVKAFWTIARQPARNIAPLAGSQCGISYVHDRSDVHSAYSDAPGGKWEAPPPRPALPSSRDIDQANEALDWLLYLDEGRRKVLVVGATSKRGDVGRNINWIRVRAAAREFSDMPARTLRGRYREALRIIVNELTLARMSFSP